MSIRFSGNRCGYFKEEDVALSGKTMLCSIFVKHRRAPVRSFGAYDAEMMRLVSWHWSGPAEHHRLHQLSLNQAMLRIMLRRVLEISVTGHVKQVGSTSTFLHGVISLPQLACKRLNDAHNATLSECRASPRV